eukprot:57481_1
MSNRTATTVRYAEEQFASIVNTTAPNKKQKLDNNELNNYKLNDKIIDIDERNKLIDEIMPELNTNKEYWIKNFNDNNIQIKADKKWTKPTRKRKKKNKTTKVVLDCHKLCQRFNENNKNKNEIKSYKCLCGQIFTKTPPKIDAKTGKKKYTNIAVQSLNRHMTYHLRTYFKLSSNSCVEKK